MSRSAVDVQSYGFRHNSGEMHLPIQNILRLVLALGIWTHSGDLNLQALERRV